MFTVIDLGITQPDLIVEWTCKLATYFQITRVLPRKFADDTEIELYFKFTMFQNWEPNSATEEVTWCWRGAQTSYRSKPAFKSSFGKKSLNTNVDNTETLQEAKSLSRELDEDIECRIKRYSKCL
jgi:hypothetical protein